MLDAGFVIVFNIAEVGIYTFYCLMLLLDGCLEVVGRCVNGIDETEDVQVVDTS